jgi:hypothetical protein
MVQLRMCGIAEMLDCPGWLKKAGCWIAHFQRDGNAAGFPGHQYYMKML